MDRDSKTTWQLVGAWCGPVFLATFVLTWGWMGMNLPPSGPGLSAAEIARHYAEHSVRIRAGFVLSVVAIGFYLPWTAALSAIMARTEGRNSTLSQLQLTGGALTVMVVSMSAACWIIAAFRPDRSPEATQMLHDSGWLIIDQLYICTSWQMVAGAVAVLTDTSDAPIMPRWAGWIAIWCAVTFFPASLTAFLKVGPFAWNGVASYYVPYLAWLTWFSIFASYMIRHGHREFALATARAPGAAFDTRRSAQPNAA
jgi:hypothetical protein